MIVQCSVTVSIFEPDCQRSPKIEHLKLKKAVGLLVAHCDVDICL